MCLVCPLWEPVETSAGVLWSFKCPFLQDTLLNPHRFDQCPILFNSTLYNEPKFCNKADNLTDHNYILLAYTTGAACKKEKSSQFYL